ncbi:MAG TPA: PilT/PilU family type 4a pilus ATPase [Candidatus Hydrogenedentes bacterium]|nr:PilT/PilU family type 4a pilus ATPase [Candidatus Hydrogenedentota bacterium]HOS03957.1 PilT/PilU family type 4a pilus ATPase [Candidatus Hydrogenedentota bacterium]
MTETILGLGQNKPIRTIIQLCENQLRKNQGYPRIVHARAGGIHLIGEKPDYEASVSCYKIQADTARIPVAELRQTLVGYGESCSVAEQGGMLTVTVPAPDKPLDDRAIEALEKIAQSLPMPEVWRVHGEKYRVDHISVELLFQAMIRYKASDTHLCPGEPPVFRIDNQMRHSEIIGPLSSEQISALIHELATEVDWKEFQEHKQASFNFHQVGLGYSRISCFIKSGAPHCTIRFLPEIIPSFEELNIPGETMTRLATLHHGLVLVTGMTGSGKSTTVAALVDWINNTRQLHILTIENPVEYVHMNKKSMVSQRNTGTDVLTFGEAVRGALRHDPDVVVIGEMRDPDTIRSAINAAATGHLVISTLHANTAAEVVNRIVSFFDPVERDLVKLQLRDCIRCVICQRLVPRVGGGRVPILEIMFNDIKPLNSAILAGDTDGIRIGMQQSVSHSFIFEDYLFRLYKKGILDLEHAREAATDVSILDQMVMGTYSIPRLDSIKSAHMGGQH